MARNLHSSRPTSTAGKWMRELTEWVMMLGLGVAIAGIFMLSSQIEKQTRATAEMMHRSNEMLLAQLEQLANPSLPAPEPVAGVILEKTLAQCRNPLTQMSGPPQAVETR